MKLKHDLIFIIILSIFTFSFLFIVFNNSKTIFQNQYDDAYITYRYAINLAEGKGAVFNIGEKTDSASSFSYLLILSLFYKSGFHNLELISALIGIFSLIFISYFIFHIIYLLTNNYYISIFFCIISITHGFMFGWAVSGMETAFYTLLITAFFNAYLTKSSKIIQIILLAIILITRFEGIILFAVWLMFEINKLIKEKKLIYIFILQISILFSVIIAFYSFKYFYYNSIFPHALDMKSIVNYYLPKPVSLIKLFKQYSFFILCLSAASIYMIFSENKKELFIIYVFIILSFISFLSGPYSDIGRYTVHIFPLLLITASIAINFIINNNKKYKYLVLFIFLFSITVETFYSIILMRNFFINLSYHQISRKKVGEYINQNINNEEIIISTDIGCIAYYAKDNKFIDLTGLTSIDVLKKYKNHENPDSIILSKKPEFIADSLIVNKEKNIALPDFYLKLSKAIKSVPDSNIDFSKLDLKNPLFSHSCNNEYKFAVIDISKIYK